MSTPFYVATSDNVVKVGLNNPDPQSELDIVGDLAVSGTITAGGSPVGSISVAAVGAVPNANGASASGSTLTLQPASALFPGVVTAGAQTLGAGVKTVAGLTSTVEIVGPSFHKTAGAAGGLEFDATEVYVRAPNNGGEVHLTSLGGTEYARATSAGLVLSSARTVTFPYTDSTGTPGDATINKASGRSAIANGATVATITNSLCTATSLVMVMPEDGLGTALWVKCVPGSGSFVVTVGVDPGATWKFRWVLFLGA